MADRIEEHARSNPSDSEAQALLHEVEQVEDRLDNLLMREDTTGPQVWHRMLCQC